MPVYCDGRPCGGGSGGGGGAGGGSLLEWMVNKTGAPSVKGMVVDAGPIDNSFVSTGVNDDHPVGVVFDAGIADGSLCRVVKGGRAQVLLKNGTASTSGNWVKTADVAGRADATLVGPPGFNVTHFQEIGHCQETKGAGVGVLAWCSLHFN